MSDITEEEFIKEFAREKGITIERAKALLHYQLKLTAMQTFSALDLPAHPVREEFDELIKLCNKYDTDLFNKIKINKSESYDSSFLFMRDALNKTNMFFSTKFLSSHNFYFSDPFYFSDLSRVFHDLKMTLIELVHIFEWQLRKKINKKNLEDLIDLIDEMNLETEVKDDLHFIRKVRNDIIHRQGNSKKSSEHTIYGIRFSLKKGEKVIDETDPSCFSHYFLLMRRLIDIYYVWINKNLI